MELISIFFFSFLFLPHLFWSGSSLESVHGRAGVCSYPLFWRWRLAGTSNEHILWKRSRQLFLQICCCSIGSGREVYIPLRDKDIWRQRTRSIVTCAFEWTEDGRRRGYWCGEELSREWIFSIVVARTTGSSYGLYETKKKPVFAHVFF